MIRHLSFLLALLLLACAELVHAAQPTISYHEPLARLQYAHARQSRTADAAESLVGMRFEAFGRAFDLRLERNDGLFDALSPLHRPRPEVLVPYRGELRDVPGSWVRLSVLHGDLHGLIWDGAELYAIAPARGVGALLSGASSAGRDPVIFRWRDVNVRFHDKVLQRNGPSSYDQLVSELESAIDATSVTRRLSVGIVGDVELARTFADPQSEMLARMNLVEGIFVDQLHLVIDVDDVVQYTAEPDPFTPSLPEDLLSALAAHRSSTPALRALGVTHLFTGRELSGDSDETGQVLGVAYLGEVCDARLAASLTQVQFDVSMDAIFVAHELGHTLGAPHDAEPGSACAATPPGYLMDPFPQSTHFSQCSLDQILPVLANASCLTPVTDGDLALSVSAPASVLLGDTARVVLRVDNDGAQEVFGVHVGYAMDEGTEITDPDYSGIGEDCEFSTSGVSCVIQSIAAQSSIELPVNVHAIGLGPATEHAGLSSANDSNPSNDFVDHDLNVEGAVMFVPQTPDFDVVVSKTIGGSSFVSFENASPIQATHVEANVTSSYPIAFLDASLGLCNYTAHLSTTAKCSIATLPANLSTRILFSVDAPADLQVDEHRTGHLSVTMSADQPIALSSEKTVRLNLLAYGSVANLGLNVVEAPFMFDASESAHLRVEVYNSGPDAAPDTLTFSFPASFTAANIVAEEGTCQEGAAPGEWVCESPLLTPNQRFAIELDISTDVPGSYDWAATLSGAAFDDDELDNSASGRFEVTGTPPPPPPPDDPHGGSSGGNGSSGGGGGESTLLVGVALLGIALQRRGALRRMAEPYRH